MSLRVQSMSLQNTLRCKNQHNHAILKFTFVKYLCQMNSLAKFKLYMSIYLGVTALWSTSNRKKLICMQSIAKLTFVTYDDKIVNFAPLCSPCKGNWYVYSYSTVAFFTKAKSVKKNRSCTIFLKWCKQNTHNSRIRRPTTMKQRFFQTPHE